MIVEETFLFEQSGKGNPLVSIVDKIKLFRIIYLINYFKFCNEYLFTLCDTVVSITIVNMFLFKKN
jgi:hypothetical protein